eukprot:1395123-Amorphochlora_amoeboformis.AAC.1
MSATGGALVGEVELQYYDDLEATEPIGALRGGKLRETSASANLNCCLCLCSIICLPLSLPFSMWAWVCNGFAKCWESCGDPCYCSKIICCSEAKYLPCIIYYCCCPCKYLDEIQNCKLVDEELWKRIDPDEDDEVSDYNSQYEDDRLLGSDRPYTTM